MDCKRLAHAGASYEGLILGKFQGYEISFEVLIEEVHDLEFLLVHVDEVDFDADDDVLGRDFSDFKHSSYLLELTPDFNGPPDWINQLPEALATRESRTLFSALNMALEKGMGPDLYPFELAPLAVAKLRFPSTISSARPEASDPPPGPARATPPPTRRAPGDYQVQCNLRRANCAASSCIREYQLYTQARRSVFCPDRRR